MSDPWHILASILVAAGITWALRAVPFALLAPLRNSELLTYLGERMPVGIMLILAAYTVRDTSFAELSDAGTVILAMAVTAALHLWRGEHDPQHRRRHRGVRAAGLDDRRDGVGVAVPAPAPGSAPAPRDLTLPARSH